MTVRHMQEIISNQIWVGFRTLTVRALKYPELWVVRKSGRYSCLCWPSLRSLTLGHIKALFLSLRGAGDD